MQFVASLECDRGLIRGKLGNRMDFCTSSGPRSLTRGNSLDLADTRTVNDAFNVAVD